MKLTFSVDWAAKGMAALFVVAFTRNAVGQSISKVSLTPATVVGGASSTGIVSLKAEAPSGGVNVSLSSSSPGYVTVPSKVTIAAGKYSAVFAVATKPYTKNYSDVIKASDSGSSVSATLNVQSDSIKSMTLASLSLGGNDKEYGTITLTNAAPNGGWKVQLASSDPNYVTVPASIVIPQGASQATFPITAKAFTANYTSKLEAKDGLSSQFVSLNVVQDSLAAFTLSPTTVIGGSAATGTIALTSAAPYGGWQVNLKSQLPSSVVLPTSVVVPEGDTTVSFIATTTTTAKAYANLVTASDVKSTRTFTLNVGQTAAVVDIPQGAANLAYDPVHQLLLAVPNPTEPYILVINPSTGKIVKKVNLPFPTLIVTMSGDNSKVFVACNDGTVRILDADTYALEGTAVIPGGSAVQLIAIPHTSESFVADADPWTYIFDGETQRPNNAAMGIVQAISEDGTHFVGCDYRYGPGNYAVAKINAQGFYDQVTGYGPVTPNLTYADNHPVNGNGVVLDPNTGDSVWTLPFISSANRQLTGFSNSTQVLSLSWSPNTAQVTDVATQKSLGTFLLPNTDGGMGPVIPAGSHRIAYLNFGFISDFQILIITNPLIP